ncbi:MAG: PEP-CTERM sorting domain-containing protein [Desulfococcaceae bacterium]
MKQFVKKLAVAVAAFSLLYGNAYALSLGTNITIPDKNTQTGSNTWYSSTSEDNEVEPGMVAAQKWDLEGFFLDGTILSMIGGYDFANGVDGYTSGDIFIDIDGDAVFGDIHGKKDGNTVVTNTFGYDYALTLDFSSLTYDIYKLDSDTSTIGSYYKQNQGSNPWRYASGGNLISENIGFEYLTGLSNAAVDFTGGSHNVVTGIDLAFLAGNDFTAHYTMGCGNDNLMGQGTVPTPEPATMFLLGTGLIGLGGLGRKKIFKK